MLWILEAVLVLSAALLWLSHRMYRALMYQVPGEEALAQDTPGALPKDEACAPYLARMQADWQALHDEPHEGVHITADDGTPLFARYYHHGDGAPLAILFHGYKGSSLRDGMGGYRILYGLGFNVLLPDQRAHGQSGGHTITLGVKERCDCRAWADYAAARFGPETPIFLMGVSMGASTVLLACGEALPENVCGVIADCGYTSPEAIGKKCIRQWFHLPAQPLYAVGRLGMLLFGGADLNDADCRAALAASRLPVLFVHGDADDFVPCAMGKENYEACRGKKQLLVVHGAPHAMAYYFDTAAYTKAVTEFCAGVLAERKTKITE